LIAFNQFFIELIGMFPKEERLEAIKSSLEHFIVNNPVIKNNFNVSYQELSPELLVEVEQFLKHFYGPLPTTKVLK
jgi:hypothetical protein